MRLQTYGTLRVQLLIMLIMLTGFIPFEDFDAHIDSGWFTLTQNGQYAAVVSVPDELIIINTSTGEAAERVRVSGEIITAEYSSTGQLAIVTAEGTAFTVWHYDAGTLETIATLDEQPVRVWFSETGDIWVEVLTQTPYVLNLNTQEQLPSAPYADTTAVLRNGRTYAPFAVTSSADGLVKLWNMETGEELGQVPVNTIPDFGRVTDMSGWHLAVNIQANSEVALLNFETGEIEAHLPVENGAYIHGLMVVPGGEQVIGVQFDDAPIVGMWDVATGEFTNLGEFHTCSRVPDLMRLSADGSTLVIGCGEGLDVWHLDEITSANVSRFQSVSQIDFADYGEFRTGAFSVSPNGQYASVISATGEVFTWNINGEVIDIHTAPMGDPLETAFSSDSSHVYSIHSDGENVMVIEVNLMDGTQQIYEYQAAGQPQTIWVNEDGIWFEIVTPDNTASIVNLTTGESIPYAPADDPEAVVRIGRITPPYAVTSSVAGLVKRWNLQTGEVEASAPVTDGPAVFGQISRDGHYLAWRDPQSNQLHRLDFLTGEDQVIADLNNQYVQGYFISRDGGVILGVDVDFEPIVVTWDVTTGERITLGRYRECSRVPDLIRMSADGSTIVIGCDTGLDFWRIGG